MPQVGHSKEGLEEGIRNCKKNIKVLEAAIEDERTNIANYRIMMDSLDSAQNLKQEAEANVHIEVVQDGVKE